MDDLHCDRDAEFNLYLAIEALQGITEALFDLTTDIPRSGPQLTHWTASVSGLAWAGTRIAQEVRHFIDVVSTDVQLPSRHSDIRREDRQLP